MSKSIRVSDPVHDKLLALQAEQCKELDRIVTLTEVIAKLISQREGFGLLAAHTTVRQS